MNSRPNTNNFSQSGDVSFGVDLGLPSSVAPKAGIVAIGTAYFFMYIDVVYNPPRSPFLNDGDLSLN